MSLKIKESSWHYQVYDWWHLKKYGFHHSSRPTAVVNLCLYMRAVLFYSWLRGLFLTRVGFGTWPLGVMGLFGTMGYFFGVVKGMLGLIYGVCFAVGPMAAAVLLMCIIEYEDRGKLDGIGDEIVTGVCGVVRPIVDLGFWGLLWTWIKAIHKRVCPLIEVEKETK